MHMGVRLELGSSARWAHAGSWLRPALLGPRLVQFEVPQGAGLPWLGPVSLGSCMKLGLALRGRVLGCPWRLGLLLPMSCGSSKGGYGGYCCGGHRGGYYDGAIPLVVALNLVDHREPNS
ncbi:hypothetical protein D8674_005315 [Pyrus ussuriensis x Pyrus communis]|uniref:Uncharacterized protein n=1 Tax=Pyrus ussuriensis x Pyrus communis TaxID=2448454 RepID=A0A5N5FR44_9ROSA|nr:hypothetical protein D8674_005315 [Pyrus ussuriensis x Pyrus communis]